MISEISSLQTSSIYDYLQSISNNKSASETKNVVDSTEQDTLTISNEAYAYMSKPPALDFESMSDEEFSDWLTHMQQETGAIPGTEDTQSVSELTSEELQELKELLAQQQEERMQEQEELMLTRKEDNQQRYNMADLKMQNAISSYEASMLYGGASFTTV